MNINFLYDYRSGIYAFDHAYLNCQIWSIIFVSLFIQLMLIYQMSDTFWVLVTWQGTKLPPSPYSLIEKLITLIKYTEGNDISLWRKINHSEEIERKGGFYYYMDGQCWLLLREWCLSTILEEFYRYLK